MKKSPLNSDAKWVNRGPGTNMTQKEKLKNLLGKEKDINLASLAQLLKELMNDD